MQSVNLPPRVAVEALRRIAERWRLSGTEVAQLLGVHERTLQSIYEAPDRPMPPDIRKRLANLVLICEGLAALFGAGPIADDWIRRPNRDFGNEPPIRRLTSGLMGDVIAVRRYLDLARQRL